MKRRIFKEDKQAVSPVIATILMVAITVVLAATLYMMIDTGDDGAQLLAGGLSYSTDGSRTTAYTEEENGDWQAHARIRVTLDRPSSAAEDDVTIVVIDDGGEELGDGEYELAFSLLDEDDRVATGTRIRVTVTGLNDGDNIRNYEVVMRVSGYDGAVDTTIR